MGLVQVTVSQQVRFAIKNPTARDRSWEISERAARMPWSFEFRQFASVLQVPQLTAENSVCYC